MKKSKYTFTKKITSLLLGMVLTAGLLAGCGNKVGVSGSEENTVKDKAVTEPTETEKPVDDAGNLPTVNEDRTQIRVGSMKGPTSIGLVSLMQRSENGETANDYNFTMEGTADVLLPQVISGDLDIVLVPANVAAVLYNKTEGGVTVIDINTLGVLYMVSADTSVSSIEDLKGRTVYTTGKGTTPDYVLQYLLAQNGIDISELTIEYKSEATEVAAVLNEDPEAVGLLPQPYVTALETQNDTITTVLDMTVEWDKVQADGSGSMLVTGVTVVRNEFLEAHPDEVAAFVAEHNESAAYANENVSDAAALVEKYGIVEKAAIAEKAIPYCNITCIAGEEMKLALSGYLQVLYDQDAASIGGALPGEDFYE